ncbi:MAG: diaminopimelate decarboxylase, partial [Candidatus Aureabacteria bacterium]|nr:diaminopimelate decarboxylase [Candidatus Auribacterota bacterium]
MHDFHYKGDGFLYCEDVRVHDVAERYGTPAYVYSYKTFTDHFQKLKKAFSAVPSLVCYSVKTCSNLSLLKIIHGMGGGFDVVSIGELKRVERATGDVSQCVFAGVGKREDELQEAIEMDIYSFTVESAQEMEMLQRSAEKLGKKASFAIRINPDVDPKTHRYISTGKKENKFGIDMISAFELYRKAKEMGCLIPQGVHMHIGSQITTIDPYVKAIEKMIGFIERLKKEGIPVDYFDIGGGFGIIYNEENPPTAAEIGKKLIPLLKRTGLRILLEPGRFIAGNAGILLTKVVYIKENPEKKFAIVDAGMNDLIRPSLYEAYHKIVRTSGGADQEAASTYDIVGPICESGDYLALGRGMPELSRGELLAVMSAGAYGFSMSSNYNARLRAPEVLVRG